MLTLECLLKEKKKDALLTSLVVLFLTATLLIVLYRICDLGSYLFINIFFGIINSSVAVLSIVDYYKMKNNIKNNNYRILKDSVFDITPSQRFSDDSDYGTLVFYYKGNPWKYKFTYNISSKDFYNKCYRGEEFYLLLLYDPKWHQFTLENIYEVSIYNQTNEELPYFSSKDEIAAACKRTFHDDFKEFTKDIK